VGASLVRQLAVVVGRGVERLVSVFDVVRDHGREVARVIGGVRRGAGARSDDGKAIEKGAEVVIERYEKGIAYVRRWEEFTRS